MICIVFLCQNLDDAVSVGCSDVAQLFEIGLHKFGPSFAEDAEHLRMQLSANSILPN